MPPDAATPWSARKLAEALGVSHMTIARVWRKHALKPRRLERYVASNDPDFERKAAEIIGLYLHPPQHAAVFCVDERTAIWALDRKDRVSPLSPGRAERHTLAEFVAFLIDLVVNQLRGKEIHVIADNLSVHKAERVGELLARHRNVHPHFTPTYSSWLNQVERWFALITNQALRRSSFDSVTDLKRKMNEFVQHHKQHLRPFQWTAAADSILATLERLCEAINATSL
jgi:transposase